jgi:hypothetical protein
MVLVHYGEKDMTEHSRSHCGGQKIGDRERERERREETNALHRHALSDLFSPRRSCLLMAHSSD